MTVPGIGPIVSSAMIAAIGSGAAFARGRDFSAWIADVDRRPNHPRAHLQAGQRLLAHALHASSPGHSATAGKLAKARLRGLAARAAQRLHPNVLASALANKLARIAWTVLAQERSYETRLTKAAA